MSRSESYLDNVPMKLSKKFEPFDFPIEYDVLPELRSHEELMQRFTYEFNAELCSLEIANQRDKEICDEAERVRQRQFLHHQMLLEKQQQEEKAKRLEQEQQQQQQQQQQKQTSVDSSPSGSLSSPNSSSSSSNLAVVPVTSSVTVVIPNGNASSSSSCPPLSPSLSSTSLSNQTPASNLKKINTREFEVVGSSPFDDALLKSIDEKKELNSIFETVYQSSSSKASPSTGPTVTVANNSYSHYNHFNHHYHPNNSFSHSYPGHVFPPVSSSLHHHPPQVHPPEAHLNSQRPNDSISSQSSLGHPHSQTHHP